MTKQFKNYLENNAINYKNIEKNIVIDIYFDTLIVFI